MITIRPTLPPLLGLLPALSPGRERPRAPTRPNRAWRADGWIPIRHARQYSLARPDGSIVIAVRHYAAYGSNPDPACMPAYCPYSPTTGTGSPAAWRRAVAGEA